ncbi:hpp family protein [Mucor ambiguus]|uniref:Hpp family protein n=1 Tax=Mucor ambiguus TaxID=91626 RepID=A0A0C9N606_9FUNG|nr:hpp family protein [Mucor ambiguus]
MPLLKKLPYALSHFLGYRGPDHALEKNSVWRIYMWCFIASWLGIAVVEVIFAYGPSFQAHNTPMIVASFGATAVLVYGVIESPLAQPRNVIGGQIIGALTGVIISQLFLGIQKNWASEGQYTAVQWVGGATAMAISLLIMQITKCVHPPGGATAVIPVTTPAFLEIKWLYIGVVVLSAVIQVFFACLINNIDRRYPVYWWAPSELPIKVNPTELTAVLSLPTSAHGQEDVVADNLTVAEERRINTANDNENDNCNGNRVAQKHHNSSSSSSSLTAYEKNITVDQAISALQKHAQHSDTKYILLTSNALVHSPGLSLTSSERQSLETVMHRLSPQ